MLPLAPACMAYSTRQSSSTDKASTAWSEQRLGFIIALPKKQIYQPTELVPVFRGDLLTCFQEKKPQIPVRSSGAVDDWADVEMDSATGKPDVVEKPAKAVHSAVHGAVHGTESQASDFLPAAESLPPSRRAPHEAAVPSSCPRTRHPGGRDRVQSQPDPEVPGRLSQALVSSEPQRYQIGKNSRDPLASFFF